MKQNSMSHLARIGLVVETIYLITRTPTSRAYIDIVARHISRRLSRSQRNALDKRFVPEIMLQVIKTAAALMRDQPLMPLRPHSSSSTTAENWRR